MYIGPETLMPLASVLAAIAGVAMLFWRKTVEVVRTGRELVTRAVGRILERS